MEPKRNHRKHSKMDKVRDEESFVRGMHEHKKSKHERPKNGRPALIQKSSGACVEAGSSIAVIRPGVNATCLVENCIASKICSEHFGLELDDLKRTLRSQAKKLENKLGQLSHIQLKDPDSRIEFGSALIRDMLGISKVSTDLLSQAFTTMQSTMLAHMHSRMSSLQSELASSRAALRLAEREKTAMEAQARIKLKQERAALEAALREELQTCQICLVNPRNILIVPCFHGQYCAACLKKHQRNSKACPTCRMEIRGTLPYIA